MTIKQKQWQLYYLGYYGGEIDGIWGTQSTMFTWILSNNPAVSAIRLLSRVNVSDNVETTYDVVQTEYEEGLY